MAQLDNCTHGGDCPAHPDANGVHNYDTPENLSASVDELTKAIMLHTGLPGEVVVTYDPAGQGVCWSVKFVAKQRRSGRVWKHAYGTTLLGALRNARAFQIHKHPTNLIDRLAPDTSCPWPRGDCRCITHSSATPGADWRGVPRFAEVDAVAAAVEMQDLSDAARWTDLFRQDDEREDTGP